MTTKTIDRLDSVANNILLVWAGMALCVNLFVTPLIFKYASNCELAELITSKIATRLDITAWLVFGTAFLLVKGIRFVVGIVDDEVISYMRLWSATAMLAILVCFTSTFIVAPKLCAYRSHVGIAMEVGNMSCNNDASFHGKAFKISRQLTFLRTLLAIGMAVSIKKIPRNI